ncbi:hypothetical protein K469DRAFT_715707 [Zopfia rhizophila CBS 207.26]|uniref:Uncharacterized protein n=1 Tax=Zopfia rhizophila CBS 207.26 TaxID=1314779 RepID=A0A6A6DQ85_9PEZI|nr:hypothetical protein K469DRAFT_715707 [Zopfia rhizophila CBS 207.26]
MLAGGRATHRGWLEEGVNRASMIPRTILPTDEELGKKDDDHKPRASGRISRWGLLKTPLRWRRRRILLTVVGLYLVYICINSIPNLWAVRGQTWHQIVPMTNEDHNQAYDAEPTGAPLGTKTPKGGSPPYAYTGQIRFYRLAASLHGSAHTQGWRPTNRNVLFGISNLKSATVLLPMICEMSRWSRNWVHAVFMGREDIPLVDLLEINGIDKEKCPAIWHDARPDYTEYSSEHRAELSVMAAMTHIHTYLHPQVVITDDSLQEDAFFVRGMRAKAKMLSIPIIEVPKDRLENLMWITRLDAGSLKNWHQATVDVLIQAPSGSSGGLIRLLKSLQQADYSGLKPPRLIIELPMDIDPPTKEYLKNFVWPPASTDNPLGTNQVILRRRIASQHATQEDSSIRFVELFYPASTLNSHILLLSSQVQLSPLYYHYLKYTLLEYKYSAYGESHSEHLMGISLDLPSHLLDGESTLKPPLTSDMHTSRYRELFPEVSNVPFLWQAPNSHAALYFGDKWAEFHSFLSNRVTKHQASKSLSRAKVVSETLPGWTKYMLELMRTRGYSLLYPATVSESLATVHNELYHLPEEFQPHPPSDQETEASTPPKITEPFLTAEKPPSPPENFEPPIIPFSRPLHLAIPFEGDLPEIPHLPYLLHDGKMIHADNSTSIATTFANSFREQVGGCMIPEGKHRKVEQGSAKDLFCFGDEDEEDWEVDVTVKEDEEEWDPFGLEKEKKEGKGSGDDTFTPVNKDRSPKTIVPGATAVAEPRQD